MLMPIRRLIEMTEGQFCILVLKKNSQLCRDQAQRQNSGVLLMQQLRLCGFILLSELQVKTESKTTIWCDNLSATHLAANPILHARTKTRRTGLIFCSRASK